MRSFLLLALLITAITSAQIAPPGNNVVPLVSRDGIGRRIREAAEQGSPPGETRNRVVRGESKTCRQRARKLADLFEKTIPGGRSGRKFLQVCPQRNSAGEVAAYRRRYSRRSSLTATRKNRLSDVGRSSPEKNGA